MKFVYAKELKMEFSVFGHFYDLDIGGKTFNCRSCLEITDKSIEDFESSKPNAVVVMMNPGSSKPLDGKYQPKKFKIDEITFSSWSKEFVPTRPDIAQYQIMRLMLLKSWSHVRVLNLSDLRNGNSKKFATEYKRAEKLDPSLPHSIMHKGRNSELTADCHQGQQVIAGWGSVEVLRKPAQAFLGEISPVDGLRLEHPWFRYPSPHRKDQKLSWLKEIIEELKHNK